jgi:hypothetical protein
MFVFTLGIIAILVLLIADVYYPGSVVIDNLREKVQTMNHSAAFDRHPNVESLYISGFLAGYAAAIILLFTVPGRVANIARSFCGKHELLRQFFIGLAVNLIFVAIIVLSVFTPFTFPLAIFSGLILFAVSFLGSISILFRIAGDFFRWAGLENSSPLLKAGYGLLVFSSLGTLPYFGVALRFFLWLLGSGLVISTKFGSGKKWTLRPLLEEFEQ